MKNGSTCITECLFVYMYMFNYKCEALFQSYGPSRFLVNHFDWKDFKSPVSSPSMTWSAMFKRDKHIICFNSIL